MPPIVGVRGGSGGLGVVLTCRCGGAAVEEGGGASAGLITVSSG